MEIIYQAKAIEDVDFWKTSGNIIAQNRISKLLKDIAEHPFTGIGKPKPLKHNLQSTWSRKINDEHRIIYELYDGNIHIFSLQGHYFDK